MDVNKLWFRKIGKLHLLSVYEYVDGAKLFSCENLSGQKYIAFWINTTEEYEKWFFVPVSKNRLKEVEDKKIFLRDIFSLPEKKWVWEVKEYFGEKENKIQRINVKDIKKSDLPEKNVLI